jgi:hypothetical protein
MSKERTRKPKRSDGRDRFKITCEAQNCDFEATARGWIAAGLVADEHGDETGHNVAKAEVRE